MSNSDSSFWLPTVSYLNKRIKKHTNKEKTQTHNEKATTSNNDNYCLGDLYNCYVVVKI